MAGLSRAYKRRGNMVANTGGPIMCLDAGSRLSYPGSGTTWTDLSGNGYNGTLTNGPTYNAANYGSIVFDGVNDYVPTTLNIGGYTALSAAAWIKTTKPSTEVTSDYPGGFEIWVPNDGKITFYAYGTATFGYRTSTATITTGNWVHVYGGYNGGTGTIDTYVNGALDNGALTGVVPASIKSSTPNIAIGASASVAYFFNGNIGQVTIYNRALSAAEVATNFNLTRGRYGI